mgnify:FL=1
MKKNYSAFIATSLDGFIAKLDGNIDWLHRDYGKLEKGEDCGFTHFMSSRDFLLMGRKTYEQVCSSSEWPYSIPVGVLSSISHQDNQHAIATFRTFDDAINFINKQSYSSIYVDGGVTISHLLKLKILNEITITYIPILLGQGYRLFNNLPSIDFSTQLVQSKSFPNGFTQSHYKILY